MIKLLDRVLENRTVDEINAMRPYELLREISYALDDMLYEHAQSIEVNAAMNRKD